MKTLWPLSLESTNNYKYRSRGFKKAKLQTLSLMERPALISPSVTLTRCGIVDHSTSVSLSFLTFSMEITAIELDILHMPSNLILAE